jgi:hypothetical protein
MPSEFRFSFQSQLGLAGEPALGSNLPGIEAPNCPNSNMWMKAITILVYAAGWTARKTPAAGEVFFLIGSWATIVDQNLERQ